MTQAPAQPQTTIRKKPELVKPSFDQETGIVDFGGLHLSAEKIERLIDETDIRDLIPSENAYQVASRERLVFADTTPNGSLVSGGFGLKLVPPPLERSRIFVFTPGEGDKGDFEQSSRWEEEVLPRIEVFLKGIEGLQEKYKKVLAEGTVRVFQSGESVRKQEAVIVMSSPEIIAKLAEFTAGCPHTISRVRINYIAKQVDLDAPPSARKYLERGDGGDGEEKVIMRINGKDLDTVLKRLREVHPELTTLADSIEKAKVSPEPAEAYGQLTGSGFYR